ncbi:MAG: hypothetical protein KF795_01825 [Labilithrix sp.]|nr:hypothetical protein [Labilithrix sp.]
MAAPPPKPKSKQTPEDLAEVERALSVLQGRHPEHERVRREDEENRARRKAEIEAVSSVEARRVRSRRSLIAVGVVVVGVVAVAGAVVLRSELARRGRIEQAADPYRAMGFVVVDTSSRGEPSKIEANVPAGCVLATSSTGAPVRVAHAGGAVEGPTPVLTCLCEGGAVTVTGDLKAGEGLALLRTDASAVGGSRAFAFLPLKPGTIGRTDQACAEGSLDAWLDAKRWTQESPAGATRPIAPIAPADSERWLAADPKRAALRRAGFELRAIVEREAPFAVVEIPAESCVLLAPERAGDQPSLRLKGGALAVGPAAGGAIWCTAAEGLVLAQREGEGELAVLTAPAARAGGLAGAREAAARAELAIAAATVPAGDRGWSATQVLLASGIPATLVTAANAPDLGGDPEARIVALSLERGGSLVVDLPPDVYSFCEPALDKALSTVCVFSGPQKWRADGAGTVAGLARAKHPFWLFGLQGVNEPAALKAETQLVNLARRLHGEGFEPTTIEAVTELDKGAEVLGRANEDAIVAFSLAPVAPWVFPYTDGPAWTLESEPRIVPVKPLERVTVTATTKTLPPKAIRRTVVFRRHSR